MATELKIDPITGLYYQVEHDEEKKVETIVKTDKDVLQLNKSTVKRFIK